MSSTIRPSSIALIEDVIVQQQMAKELLDLKVMEYLDIEKARTEHKKINQRLTSLGGQLWQEHRRLREIVAKSGRIPDLGPDIEGAFGATLLALYKDPILSTPRSRPMHSTMRKAALEVYQPGLGAPAGKLWCPISKEYFDADSVRAAHIVPQSLAPALVDYLFALGTSARLNTADNCLLVHSSVEKAFAKGNFVLLPVNPTETPIKRWKIQMTNTAAMNTDMGRTSLAKLQGTEVEFKTDARPAARFLYYHFVVTLLRNEFYRQEGWRKSLVEFTSAKPFPSPGRYLRRSMLLSLASIAGGYIQEETLKLPGNEEGTFREGKKLEDKEEMEIARQILGAHDIEARMEHDSDEEEEEEEGCQVFVGPLPLFVLTPVLRAYHNPQKTMATGTEHTATHLPARISAVTTINR